MINNFYKRLKNLNDLKPNNETNELFSELCKYAIENNRSLKIDKKILEINEICAKAEFEMEKFWAEKIINSKNSKIEIENFIYYKNYLKLTELEFINASFINEEKIKNVLFIGWWPLPLTAIILSKKFWVNCKIIDYNQEAINLAIKLVDKLGLKEKISFVKSDILDYSDTEKYDLVYWASLIFWNDNQENILKNIKNLNFSHILLRTSHKMRQLVYKKIDEKILKKFFKEELIVHPKNEIVNSFIILTK